MKHILVVNDDGINAKGLAALEAAAYSISDRVSVVAPKFEHSAQSHAITIREPIFADPIKHPTNLIRYAIQGTPTDCVRLALLELCQEPVDLVLSGINHGANIGWEVFFSGTVSAAAEAYSFGIPALAFSLATWEPEPNFQVAEKVTTQILKRLLEQESFEAPFLYNINIPALSHEQLKGLRVTLREPNVKGDRYEKRQAPDGRTYYWATWGTRHEESQKIKDPCYDVVALREHYISLTKLRYEIDDPALQAQVAEFFNDFELT